MIAIIVKRLCILAEILFFGRRLNSVRQLNHPRGTKKEKNFDEHDEFQKIRVCDRIHTRFQNALRGRSLQGVSPTRGNGNICGAQQGNFN